MTDASYWHRTNKHVIEEFRANNGEVKSRKWPVILLTTTGAKTGRKHVTPLNFSRDGDDIVVIASKAVRRRTPIGISTSLHIPKWRSRTVEKYRARATVARGPRRTRLYDAQAKVMTFFDGYRKRVKAREIPVVVFKRIGSSE